jgi:uncharacterized protein YndB with AHSA1/START domain
VSDAETGSGSGSNESDEFGTLERAGDMSILRYERRLAHPQERVWRALTEDADLAAWFPTTMEGERVAGAALHFSFRQSEAAPFDGEMLDFVPPSLMELRWADDVLRFELEPDGAGCILRLRVTFPAHGKAARDAAGWHVCLEQLGALCNGSELPWSSQPSERWRVVHRGYVERLGAEASVIGPPAEWEETHGG